MPCHPRPGSKESQATAAGWNAQERLVQLCQLYLSDPTNEDLREEFAGRCIQALMKKVAWCVFKGNCPRFLAPSTFAEDAFSLALVKFWGGIPKLSKPQRLNAWLSRVASSAVFEELRERARRRKDGPCEWATIETENENGEVVNILDDERNLDAAKRNGSLIPDCRFNLKQLIHQDILQKAFYENGNGSEHEDSDWLILKLSMDLTVGEIAERLGKSTASIRRSLKKSKKRIRSVAESRYDFTAADLKKPHSLFLAG
jgi:RNA polymerase sigma factor (sigma-70 family)